MSYGSISFLCFSLPSLSLSKGSQALVPDIKHCSSLLFSLRFAADIAQDLLIPVPEEWVECANKIKVPFDMEKKYHPEYDGYSPGERRGSKQTFELVGALSFEAHERQGQCLNCWLKQNLLAFALSVQHLGCQCGDPDL